MQDRYENVFDVRLYDSVETEDISVIVEERSPAEAFMVVSEFLDEYLPYKWFEDIDAHIDVTNVARIVNEDRVLLFDASFYE